ncbi:MAG: TonB-dependent receptor [Acidobacteriota bacterium]
MNRPVGGLLVALLLVSSAASGSGDGSEALTGTSLVQALERLRATGLNLIYSSELVRDTMRVAREPAGETPREVLESLLGPHGLAAVDGPGGALLVVAAAAAAPGAIRGVIRARDTGEPFPGVEVSLEGGGDPSWSERDGSFVLAGLAPGSYTIVARAPGYVETVRAGVVVKGGDTAVVFFELEPSPRFLDDVVVTPSQYSFLHREPGPRQFLDREEVQRMPHLGNDLFRVAHRLPGIAAGDISALFGVRGGAPDEVQVVLDGMEIHDPYHLRQFYKVLSIIDSEVIGGVDLLTGGFPIEHGDRMSGVVDLSTMVPAGRAFTLGVTGLNARALAQGTSAAGGSWLVSARVGYLDWLFRWLEAIDEEPDLQGLPKYWDGYAVLRRPLGDEAFLSAHLLVADDDVESHDLAEGEEAVGADTGIYGWVSLVNQLGDGLTARTILSATQVTREVSGSSDPGPLNYVDVRDNREFRIFGLKQAWEWEPRRSHLLRFGFDVRHAEADYNYRGTFVTRDPLFTASGPPWVVARDIEARPVGWQASLYTAGRFRVAPGVTAELGVRWDRQTWTPGEDQLSPRFNVVWDTSRFGTLRAAWGRFAQPQAIYELQVEDGIDTFHPAQSTEQAVVAWEWSSGDDLTLRIEAYRKTGSDLRPHFENLFRTYDLFPEGEPDRVEVAPDRAEARGVEIVLKGAPSQRWAWWAGCALSAVEDRIAGEWVPRSWDQRAAASATLAWLPGRNWRLSVAGLFHSGWPATESSATLVRTPEGTWEVVSEVGTRNAARTSSYSRVDLRVSRLVPLRQGSLSVFLEIMNLLDHDNVRLAQSYTFTPEGDGTLGLSTGSEGWIPFFPTFGFTWTF